MHFGDKFFGTPQSVLRIDATRLAGFNLPISNANFNQYVGLKFAPLDCPFVVVLKVASGFCMNSELVDNTEGFRQVKGATIRQDSRFLRGRLQSEELGLLLSRFDSL